MITLLIDPASISDYRRIQEAKAKGQVPSCFNQANPLTGLMSRPATDSFTKKEGPEFRNESVLVGESSLGVILADGTAIIPIQESLDYKPSIWSYYGYCTSMMEVGYCFDQAMANSKISRIVFAIDSPGGMYTGTPELGNKIYNARGTKQIIAVADPYAASGALWLGTCAEKFYLLSSGSAGSIGCLTVHVDYSEFFASAGIKHTVIRDPERKAEFNYIEALSETAKADAQQMVSDIALEFQNTVARNRRVSLKKVQEEFGQGSMLEAKKALAVGMVDGLVSSLDQILNTNGGSGSKVKMSPRVALAISRSKAS